MTKRLFDFSISLIALIIFSPILFFLAIIIKLRIGSPVFFVQLRPGLHGKPFWMVKFRTMSDDRDALGNLLSDGERLTRFGLFLRAWSFDELPELWNVIKGDMSLVGPRPLLMKYLPLYDSHQARRHEVKPGLTGWAQLNGRNSISWKEKFDLDVWYVDNRSFGFDLEILFLTINNVLRREGISAHGEATMPPFKGTKIEGTDV